MTEPSPNCINCEQPIEVCEHCGHGYIHTETKFHSCANKKTIAQAAPFRVN